MSISLRLPENAVNGNDSSHYQSMAETYEITNLDKNVKNTKNCDEYLMYRLFLLIETNYYDIWSHLVCPSHMNSLWNIW